MDKRKRWTMEWAAFIPNKGHVYVRIKDGKVVWSFGATEANARLIAAAPALLEALEAALPTLETCEIPEMANDGDLQFWLERQGHAITQAHAAIAQAKGERQ